MLISVNNKPGIKQAQFKQPVHLDTSSIFRNVMLNKLDLMCIFYTLWGMLLHGMTEYYYT